VTAIRSYDQAYRSKSPSVWPGCQGKGQCRPCGSVHDFGYSAYGGWVPRFQCSRNYRAGCPDPKPARKHRWKNGRCTVCFEYEPWVAPDGSSYRTVKTASTAGWKRRQIKRASETT
jgi:hypothetical protein